MGQEREGKRLAVEHRLDAVEAPLLRHFPLRAGERNPNELPEQPHIGST